MKASDSFSARRSGQPRFSGGNPSAFSKMPSQARSLSMCFWPQPHSLHTLQHLGWLGNPTQVRVLPPPDSPQGQTLQTSSSVLYSPVFIYHNPLQWQATSPRKPFSLKSHKTTEAIIWQPVFPWTILIHLYDVLHSEALPRGCNNCIFKSLYHI